MMLSTAQMSVELIFGLLAVATLAGVVLSRRPRLCGWLCAALVAGALGASVRLGGLVFGSGGDVHFTLMHLNVAPAALTFHFSALNMVFLWMILGVGLLATIYSVRYVEGVARHGDGDPALVVLRYYPALMLFLASMVAVVCISDLLFFFAAWGFMSLPAYALIVHDNRKPEVLYAGLKYFLFTSVGNIGILVAVLVLYRIGGDFSFQTAQATMVGLLGARPWLAHIVMGLLAFGFLTKLGVYPMGDWLPDAHPAAPSPVSALLSGVMIKLGAWDIAHSFFGLMAPADGAAAALMPWGLVLAALGCVSVILGGSAGAASNDTKRLLAYSSVSQSGYILVCLGLAIAFVATSPTVATLAFVAAMAFVISDSMHKSLLFLTAGSVLHAAGTRDLQQLGGLGEKMRSTAATAITGALSVGGIPLTAGFIGKWLLFQAALLGAAQQPLVAVYLLAIVVGGILSLAYGLKYIGAAYLGAPARAEALEETDEVPLSMRLPQLALAVGCVAAGLWPALMLRPALAGWQHLPGIAHVLPFGDLAGVGLLVRPAGAGLVGGFVPPAVLVLMVVAGLVAWGLSRLGGARTREVPSWQSGLALPLAQTRLPASGWYWPFTPVLKRTYREIDVPALPELSLPGVTEPVAEAYQMAADITARVLVWLGRAHRGKMRYKVICQTAGAVVVLLLLVLSH